MFTIIVLALFVAAVLYLTLETVIWVAFVAVALLILLKPLLIAALLIIGGAIGAVIYFTYFHNK